MKSPLVSIFIPTYNRKKLLIPCIESALAQTFTDFELVIVDNASTDGAWEICQEYAAKDSRIRIFRNEANLGPGFNGLRCLMECKGYYAKVLFSDDLIHPKFLEKTVPLIENNPDVGFVFTGAEIGGEPGQGTIHYLLEDQPNIISNKDFIYYSLFRQGEIVPNSPGASLFRLEDNRQNALMKIPSPTMQDYHEHGMGVDMIQYLITTHKYPLVAHVPEPLAFFRSHEDSETIFSLQNRKDKWFFGYQQAKIWFTNNYNYSPELKALLVNEWVRKFFQTGEWKSFNDLAKQYLFHPPEIPISDNGNEQLISDLRLAREYLSEFWLNAPSHLLDSLFNQSGKLINVHKTLINTGIKNEFLTNDEEYFVQQLITKLDQKDYQSKNVNLLLALMLYCYPNELGEAGFNLSLSHEHFTIEYIDFLFSAPIYFTELEDLSNYSIYLAKIVKFIHNYVFELPEKQAKNIALAFSNSNSNSNHINFSKLQLTEQNLKNIYIQRQNIIEYTLKNSIENAEITHDFYVENNPSAKIRLGILAQKFNGSENNCITIPTFAYLDRNQFEIIVYTLQNTDQETESFVKSICDQFNQLPESLPLQIQTIRDEDLDILFIAENLTTTINNITLLSFYRLARIQIALPSSPVSTGIKNIDYYLFYQEKIHQNYHEEYSEELAIISGCYWLTDGEIPANLTRKNLGISTNTTVFVNTNHFDHLIPEVWDVWGQILAQVPDSVLVLCPFTEGDNHNIKTIEYWGNLLKKKIIFAWGKYAIKPTRLIILFKQGYNHVQQLLSLGDIYLDSLNMSSYLSVIKSLKVGIIPIVIPGNTVRSQGGCAILQEIGMTELITHTKDDYIKLAIALGLNGKLRSEKQAQIQAKMSETQSFLDGNSFGQKIQSLLQNIWKNYIEKELISQLQLREINVIIFPDWSQSEDDLYVQLAEVISAIATSDHVDKTTLLIDISNSNPENADEILSGIAMSLMMEDDIDITENMQISVIEKMSEIQWEKILPLIQSRIVLEKENKNAIAFAKAENLPHFDIIN